MKPTIYIAHHAPAPVVKSAALTPIHVGRALAEAALPGMIGDDTGETLSSENGAYSELTALYWAWKNDTGSTHIGLMHYRRFLDFAGDVRSPAAEVWPDQLRLADYARRTEDWLAAHPGVDLVLPVAHRMPMTVAENYRDQHDPRDLAFVEARIAEVSPDYLADFRAVLAGRELLLANMVYARRDILDAYCRWAFDLLEALRAADIPRPHVSPYNARYLGFVSERLFTVFVRKYLRDHPETVVRRANILNLSRSLVIPHATGARFNGAEEVNVAFTSDRAYLPQTAAMVASLARHADPARRYNLFYLHENIGPRDLDLLASVFVAHPNVTLHAINVAQPFAGAYRARHHAPSNATYNRFLLFDLLPDVKRLVYLDVDLVLFGDVAELFDTEMGDAPLAAVTDALMTRVLATRVRTQDPDVPDLYAYLSGKLGLSDDRIAEYFNAGVLVLNFAAMDVGEVGAALKALVAGSRYFFRDQDILNMEFAGRVHHLPARFNVHNSDRGAYDNVPVAIRAAALEAKADPFIVHFAAAHQKPWREPDVEFAGLFWEALARTPFWFEVVEATRRHRSLPARLARPDTWKHGVVIAGRGLGRRFPLLSPGLLRIYRWALGRFRWLN
jgi:lipopolysaccharide biosynthesis glycosyltransferase